MSYFGILNLKNLHIGEKLSHPPHNTLVTALAAAYHTKHTKKLQTRNLSRSPLLRLPYEIIVYILLFVTENTHTWTTILPTCHYL